MTCGTYRKRIVRIEVRLKRQLLWLSEWPLLRNVVPLRLNTDLDTQSAQRSLLVAEQCDSPK